MMPERISAADEGAGALVGVMEKSEKTVERLPKLAESSKTIDPAPFRPAGSIMITRTQSESLRRRMKSQRQTKNESEKPMPETHKSTKALSAVSFHTVEIREYPIRLGDNPAVTEGPPITIGWKPMSEPVTLLVDDYEGSRPPRRTQLEMAIPLAIREDMVKHAGHSRKEMQELTKSVNIVKAKRRRTVETMKMDNFHYGVERLQRGLGNLLKPGKKKKENEMIRSARELDRLGVETEEELTDSSTGSC